MENALTVKNSMLINAEPAAIWNALTNPEETKKYMFGCETVSDWQVGSPLLWRGNFDGQELVAVKGDIVRIEPDHFLAYTTIDPNSDIADFPENYLTVTYELTPENGQTLLTVTQGNYATVADGERRYKETVDGGGWDPILIEIKKLVESN